jgi:RNA recognition motif-containing protein
LQPEERAAKQQSEMAKKLFIGNLAYAVTEDELRELFAQAGACESVSIVIDRDTGQSRGFGFVTMANNDDAERAKKQLDGTEVHGRRLRIDEANDQSTRPRGGAGGPRGPRR